MKKRMREGRALVSLTVPQSEQRHEAIVVRTNPPCVRQLRGHPASPRRSMIISIVSFYKGVTVRSNRTEHLRQGHHARV